MNVLVTGASGFVGTNLLFRLDKENHKPIAFVRDKSKIPETLDTVVVEEGDVTERQTIERAVQAHNCDCIVHLAAMHGRYGNAETEGGPNLKLMKRVNVTGSVNVFEVAHDTDVDSLILSGTLNSHPRFSADESGDVDGADYVITKRQAQQRLQNGSYAFDYTVVNPSVIVGPRDYRLVHYTTYQLVCSNRLLLPPMYMPKQINLVHVNDVTRSIMHYIENSTNRSELLTGYNTSMRRYCRLISKAAGTRCHVVPMPFARLYLPSVLDTLNDYSPLPVSSQMFNWNDRSVPADATARIPHQPATVSEIAEDTYSWYAEMELL